ncbi:MAG: hypothetical protein L3J45_05360 [Flavobacteriaceae bacterium]|nr:hypothetical protein [Flavobacteriaceae bacterium]
MKKTIYFMVFSIIGLSLIGCSKPSTIFYDFDCHSSIKSSDLHTILDAKNNFSLDIPNYWKTELYIDEYASIFTTADTTKQLTKTYLIKASLIDAKLNLNKASIQTIKTNLESKKATTVASVKQGTFQNKPALLILSKNKQNKLEKTVLHLYISVSEKHYFEIEIHCYGHKNVEKRLCEGIKYINSLNIKEI